MRTLRQKITCRKIVCRSRHARTANFFHTLAQVKLKFGACKYLYAVAQCGHVKQ